MALGEWQIFSWKSRSKQKEEETAYEKWAFPYGQPQREKLTKLLLEVFPRENVATTLIPFLTCRELYEDICKNAPSDVAVDKLLNDMKKYKRIIKKKDMPTYLTLVLANARLDEAVAYPTADEIRASAATLEKLRRDDKA
ncbi:MAG: hypothetical protein LBT12_00310 [Oscillospiraceae bacterium]|jgi:hypothetical protein|nr:hypothetical protein [Oscillospiraceae bacterium]